jgi:hypothetical protein
VTLRLGVQILGKGTRRESVMEKPTVWYLNVFVSDFEQALAFYRNRLGCR